MVAFGDVNLASDPIGGPYQAGAGGWPTIRYFNKATGADGAPYEKQTDKSMCDELGADEYMGAYVESAGSTSACLAADGSGCEPKEVEYLAKMRDAAPEKRADALARLKGMVGGAMKPELQKWLGQRVSILAQLQAKAEPPKEEL